MTMQPGDQRRAGLHTGNAILRMATLYKTTAEAVAQTVENELDAGASHVWVVLTPGKLWIVGNGHGMVRDIPAQDVAILQGFFEGRYPAGTDVRALLSQAALASIERMMSRIAQSSKIPGQDPNSEGTRGIGFLGVYQYGQEVVFVTRPRLDLAKAESVGIRDVKDVPIHVLTPPTRQQLLDDDTRYSVDDSNDFRLVSDPFGHPLDHGTKVEVSNFLPGQDDNLQPGKLAAHFSFRFGNRIRRTKTELVIVDRMTRQGRATPGGKLIYIQPIVYKGIPLVDEDVQLPSGSRFHIELYGKGRDYGSSVQVTRQGSGKFKLTDLDRFEDPWRQVKGWVEFPFVPKLDDVHWDSSKTTLLQSSLRAEWEKGLHSLEGRIVDQLAEAKKRSQASDRQQLGQDLAEATQAAIREVSFFSELLPGRRPKPNPSDDTPRTPNVLTSVEARVVNEHGRPVFGVVIRLSVRARSVAEGTTNKSGEVSFGKQPIARGYMMAMDIPEGATREGEDFDLFDITEEKPGYRFTFRLTTGQEAPPQKPPRQTLPPSIRYLFHPIEDGRPYQQRLASGVIDINTEGPDFAEAEAAGDDVRRATLVAQYGSAAITEHASPGEIRVGDLSMLLIQQSLLFARMHALLRAKVDQRQQEAKQREGRRQRTNA